MAIVLKVKWVEPSGEAGVHLRIRHPAKGDGPFACLTERGARVLKLEVARTAAGDKYLAVSSEGGPLPLDPPRQPGAAPRAGFSEGSA